MQSRADRRKQLRRGFLLTAFDLAEIAQGDCSRRRDLTQGTSLRLSVVTENVTDFTTKHNHDASPISVRATVCYTQRYPPCPAVRVPDWRLGPTGWVNSAQPEDLPWPERRAPRQAAPGPPARFAPGRPRDSRKNSVL